MNKTSNNSTEHFQYDEYYPDYSEKYHNYIRHFGFHGPLIQSVFLIPGLCVGLPTLVWSVRSLHRQLQEGACVSAFIIFLLFSDILELILIPFIVLPHIFQNHIFTKPVYYHLGMVFFSVKFWGFYLHQLVALEGILFLRNPHSSCLSSPLISIPLSLSLLMCTFTFDFLKLSLLLNCIICGFTCVLPFFSCVLTIKGFCSPEPKDRDKRLALKILAVAQVTLLVLNGPFIFVFFMPHYTPLSYSPFPIILLSLQLVSDPVLCVVCRKRSRKLPDRKRTLQ